MPEINPVPLDDSTPAEHAPCVSDPVANERKQRTRAHVLADMSVNHVEKFIINTGHIPERIVKDYGYDLVVRTFDAGGFAEPGEILLQLKASEKLQPDKSGERDGEGAHTEG
jgi:hypothetical protein